MSSTGTTEATRATEEAEATKAVVHAFYAAMNARDLDAILALYTDDASTWVLGEGPYAGRNPVSRALMGSFLEMSDLRFTIVSMIAEGDRAAIELESEGKLGGKAYRNHYHNLIVVRDGRVTELKEYFDTMLAAAAGA